MNEQDLAEEKKRGDEMFHALQANGINGAVASWLVDLSLRLKRLEDFIGVDQEPSV